MPAVAASPMRTDGARVMVIPATVAAIKRATAIAVGSRTAEDVAFVAPRSTSRRSAWSGETRRRFRSGLSAKSSDTQSPRRRPDDHGSRNDAHHQVHRQELPDRVRQSELNCDSQRRANAAPITAHGGRLRHVDHQHLGPGSTQAAKHGGGVDLAGDEGRDAARYTDPAEQQGHDADDAQEVGEPLDRAR